MLRLTLALLTLVLASQAGATCQPIDSSKRDLLRATEIVQHLPELAGWAQNGSTVFDTGSREEIGGRCYEAVYVYGVNPAKDLDLQYVFAVNLPTKTIMVDDIPNAKFISLENWRINNAQVKKP